MRLNQIAMIVESRGFVARKPGDEYVDPSNRTDIATFQGLTLLPESGIEFDTHDELLAALTQFENTVDGKIFKLNAPIRSMKAAMIVNMDTPRGLEHYVLLTKDISKLEGKLTNIPAGVIPGHGGYVMNRDVSLSERAGLKPAEVVKSDNPISPSAVAGLLNVARATAGDTAVNQMQEYLTALAKNNGTGYVIKGGAEFVKLHQKYLGEWASPIALITGQFEPSSQLSQIEDVMLDGASVSTGKIVYNTNAAEALFDSLVKIGIVEILISSKAAKGGGAAASLKGIQTAINRETDRFDPEFWKDSKVAKFKNVVNTIMENSAIDGLLKVATQEDLIPASDIEKIKNGLVSKTKQFVTSDAIEDMKSEYAANTNHPQYDPAKHAFAALARRLVNKLNSEDYTAIIRQILNNANVIQMYFDATPKGPDLICKGFKLVWPPQFDGQIKFYSGKFFSATEIKGRLGFKIGTGAAMIEPPDESLKAPIDDSAERRAEIKAQKAKDTAVGKITGADQRDVRDTNVDDVVALGRSKKA
jgi:hypothetical protein